MFPEDWVLESVGVYIGLVEVFHVIFGQFGCMWIKAFLRWNGFFFRLGVPTHMPHALDRGLRMIVGGPGPAKTPVHSVSRMKENLAMWGRILWLHFPANARCNSIRVFIVVLFGRVHVIGSPNLLQLERDLTLNHLFCHGLLELLSTFTCLAVSLKEATDESSRAMRGASVQVSDSPKSVALHTSVLDGVRVCHLHFLMDVKI